MNIVLYNIDTACAVKIADRYGFRLCHSFDGLEEGDRILLQPELRTEEEQLLFFERMAAFDERIDAVIVRQDEGASTVHYCSEPGKFFSLSMEEEEEVLFDDIVRIVDTRLGYLCAHEGI